MKTVKLTPLMEQYHRIKNEYKDALLLFQMGDFYECFFEDAKILSKELGIILTSREKGDDAPPMAGFPIKALDTYLPKLINKGYKVAIAQQVEDPKQAKGVVERAVTEVVTKGTIINAKNLKSDESNIIASLYIDKFGQANIAFLDLSTGDLKLSQIPAVKDLLDDVLSQMSVTELIKSDAQDLSNLLSSVITQNVIVQNLDDRIFKLEDSYEFLLKWYDLHNLDSFGLTERDFRVVALASLLQYVLDIKKQQPKHINDPVLWDPRNFMILDRITTINLEIAFNNRTKTKENSLLGVIDSTVTPMGARFLRFSLLHPLVNRNEIIERLERVDFFTKDYTALLAIRNVLKEVYDTERIAGLLGMFKVKPKHLLMLKTSIYNTVQIINTYNLSTTLPISFDYKKIEQLYKLLEDSINPVASNNIGEGTVFKEGFDKKIDELNSLVNDSSTILKQLLEKERERSGISNLKLGFNKVFGYYFEVSKSNLKLVPQHFIRKQTLVNAERFITEELKILEQKIISAQEELSQLEIKLYSEFVHKLQRYVQDILAFSKWVANLDFFTNLAWVALKNNYVKPEILLKDSKVVVDIKEGRHPIVEKNVDNFVPNDILIKGGENFLLITGPNMGGKSTFIRQVALISLLSQIGSFVPAKSAKLKVFDRIFARIGASDDISTGRSTFMVEMSEVSNILRHATSNSLIVLDEVGRGTSTKEGLALATAISLYIVKRIKATTIFATHFFDLTKLEKNSKIFRNYKVDVLEKDNKVFFLHTISPGVAEKSYATYVAKLANLPKEVITIASNLLNSLDEKSTKLLTFNTVEQQTLPLDITPAEKIVIDRLKNLKIESLTPLDALNLLAKLKESLETKEN